MNKESVGGIVLLAVAALAVLWANAVPDSYAAFVHAALPIPGLALPLEWVINDVLMVVFFLSVGLEIKRALIAGELSGIRRAALPLVAAAAGMAVPAAIYIAVTWHEPALIRGWAIPAATDIAFAVGVLALLGPRVPPSLKVFLLALAILDDLGAIVIIALFYSADLAIPSLLAAAVCVSILVLFNRNAVRALWPYLIVGIALWFSIVASGIHPTVAGVLLAMTIPLRLPPLAKGRAGVGLPQQAPLSRLSHTLHPWTIFAILPLFALTNAGVPLHGLSLSALLAPLPLGIALGLFLGKQLGIFTAVALMVRGRIAPHPAAATWTQIYGVAVLCGIGFTMSLLIGLLAFGGGSALANQVRLGVLAASIASALLGFAVLRFAPPIR